MTNKTRLITMTVLIALSVLGGLFGESLDADMGFFVGIVGTYVLLSVVLIASGKAKLTRKG